MVKISEKPIHISYSLPALAFQAWYEKARQILLPPLSFFMQSTKEGTSVELRREHVIFEQKKAIKQEMVNHILQTLEYAFLQQADAPLLELYFYQTASASEEPTRLIFALHQSAIPELYRRAMLQCTEQRQEVLQGKDCLLLESLKSPQFLTHDEAFSLIRDWIVAAIDQTIQSTENAKQSDQLKENNSFMSLLGSKLCMIYEVPLAIFDVPSEKSKKKTSKKPKGSKK